MSKAIFVIVEHRKNEIRDITFELLTKAQKLCEKENAEVTAVLLSSHCENMVSAVQPFSHHIVCVEDARLSQFHSDYYQQVLVALITERKPILTLLGHSSYGWELAPSLATAMEIPLVTGCMDLSFQGDSILALKQAYGGKIICELLMTGSQGSMATFPAGTFAVGKGNLNADVEKVDFSIAEDIDNKRFIQFVEAVAGEVDITQAQKIVTIGRGIKEEENIKLIVDFAKSIDAVVACSRPIVDAGWMPQDRQVGSSGKTVKPKLYIALGVSGDFQHILGMRNSDTIIAVNKDANAPIFTVADYGIVDDLFKVVPALQAKIKELKR